MILSIKDADKAEVLAALYNSSIPKGFCNLHLASLNMTTAGAKKHLDIEGLERAPRIDYLNGRVIKMDLSGDTVDSYLYDRDNGAGAALKALANVAGVFEVK